MAIDGGLVQHCLELLSTLGAVRSRRMFGGQGVYLDEHFIALIAGNLLYLKADPEVRPAFEAAGCQPFGFTTPAGKRVVMGYWSAPEQAMESAALMRPWARLALDSALRAASAKRSAVAAKRPAVAAKRPAAARKTRAANAQPGSARKPATRGRAGKA